jgi:predicted regulator of Ras-like GTPase activity (Roadblock/LC7/MglB family)
VDAARAQPPDPDLGRLVTDLAVRVPDVLHALVVSADGVPLAGANLMPEGEQADQLAAITSALISLARAGARIADTGDVTQALVVMARGTLVVMAIGDVASLAVLTTAADLDLIGYEMTMLVERAGRLIAE